MMAVLFALALAFRFIYPFYANPMDSLFSDPLRHWLNGDGDKFWDPDLIGSMDPFLYQVWIYILRLVSNDDRGIVALATGLLSAAMPFLWYRCARELMTKKAALAVGIVMAMIPSFFVIYGYFMNETLMLTMTPLAFWLTFRAFRKGGFPAFFWAALAWELCCYVRIVMLPVAFVCIFLLVVSQERKIRAFVSAMALFAVLSVPPALHSYKQLYYYAPFGSPYINMVYRQSYTEILEIHTKTGALWGFASPALYMNPLDPLIKWKSKRTGKVDITINPPDGRKTWLEALENHAVNPAMSFADDVAEGIVIFMFGQSWPDTNVGTFWGKANYHLRWAWPVLIILLGVVMARSGRLPFKHAIMPGIFFLMLFLLMLQHSMPMEGRYRKPVEPLLVFSLLSVGKWGRNRKII